MTNPYEIRLIINPDDDGYSARWMESDGQTSDPFPLALPLTQADASDLRWYLERYIQLPGAGDHARAKEIEKKLKGWGQAMFKAVFDRAEGNQVYNNLMNAAKPGDQPCLLTIGAKDPAILTQPWEMMRDKRGPLAFQGINIRRQLQGSGRPSQPTLSLPLRVLLIISRPTDTGFIDPRNSIAPMLDALDALPPGQLTVNFCDPPTLSQLEETISQARRDKRPYHIVHFDGHGTYLPHTGIGALAFERDDGTSQLIPGTQLGDLLTQLDIPLALLEACRSSDLGDQPVFGSVAPALLESGVSSVVAFSHAVHVQAAQLLVERFYRELAAGQSIGESLSEARRKLRADTARWLHLGPNAETVDLQDWFIPQLYQAGPDLALIPTDSPSPDAPTPPRPSAPTSLHNFPPRPMYRFHGRAPELLDLERAFRRYPAVLVSGMGGMGKTALAREAAAWWLRTKRFDTAIFCSFEGKIGAERAVQLIGQALEGDDFNARSEGDQWQIAVDLFHQHRALLVWDNFESTLPIYQEGNLASPPAGPVQSEDEGGAEGGRNPHPPETPNSTPDPLIFSDDDRTQLQRLYRDLTDGNPASRLLITCRPDETGLPGLKELPLTGLARPDSLHLLAAILDQKSITLEDRPGYEREEIDDLLTQLSDHPLSIELIAPHLKTLTPAQIKTEFSNHLSHFAEGSAFEDRNRSLLASLRFSTRHLSEIAQQTLPYLAWFEGGVFEAILLDFSQQSPEAWAAVRSELTATALLKVEDDGIMVGDRPYLRFHPTLPYAAHPSDVPDALSDAKARFIEVYLSVRRAAEDALHGSRPAVGMGLMAREEANLRRAIRLAFGRNEHHQASQMATTLRDYLERAGRLRERDALTAWVKSQFPEEAGLTVAICAATRQHAWTCFTQGEREAAIQMVETLITRLETEGLADGTDPTFQIASSNLYLGRIYYHAGRANLALKPLQKAIALFEQFGESQRGNLAVTLGSLANAYRQLGRFKEALNASERSLAIERESGRDREIAVGLGRNAEILMAQNRYAEADARYEEALMVARAVNDQAVLGLILQHRGGLQDEMGNPNQAVELYKQAITLFQRANNTAEEMRTCNLLAVAERKQNHLTAAEGWFARSRELALQLKDRGQQAAVAQNLGILYQIRAENTPDDKTRVAFLHQAVASVEESLTIGLEMGNQLGAADSYSQLGLLYPLLGDLAQAEENALKSLQIRESLNHPDAYKSYGILANIAEARGDSDVAAQWQAKLEAKWAEIQQLRQGPGAGEQGRAGVGGQEAQLVQAIVELAQAAFNARQSGNVEPELAEALARLVAAPAPLGSVGSFLQAVATGEELPPLPPGLPAPFENILVQLVEALEG